MKKYKIADLVVEIDMKETNIPFEFNIFECDRGLQSDITWKIITKDPPDLITDHKMQDMGGFELYRNENQVIAYYPDPEEYDFRMIVYENKFTNVVYYLPKGYNDPSDMDKVEYQRAYILAFFQEAFFLAMLYKGGISIHSVSLLYREKGFIFSARSGTGKTTHTNLWRERYGTEILDGDVTVCRIVDGTPIIYGLPWSGSSKTFLNESVELGGIVFLQQDDKNEAYIPEFSESFERLMARSFTALWFEEFLDLRFEIIMNILSTGVMCHVLNCKAEYEAVEVIKNQIDRNWK